jgi:solute carrier family 50 protein (sugar transporter)
MTVAALPKLVVSTLQIAGPILAVGVQAAALDTARKILSKKSTGKLSSLPFISLFTNCLIWSYYGILIKDMSVTVPNSIGVLAGLICTLIFQAFAEKKPIKEYGAAISAVAVASYYFVKQETQLVGYIGCALAVILMGSPLATLKTVISSKSTESLPLGTSLVTAANALSWTLYGILVAQDKMIFGPNSVGLFLALIQLSLYVIYGLPPSGNKVKETF